MRYGLWTGFLQKENLPAEVAVVAVLSTLSTDLNHWEERLIVTTIRLLSMLSP